MTWTEPSLLIWVVLLAVVAWFTPRQFQTTALAGVGAAFLAVTDVRSLVLLAILGGLAWTSMRRKWWPVAVVAVLAVLVAYKWGVRLGDGPAGIVPLGLSFFSLRILHLLFDCSGRKIARPSPGDMARYLLFFPTQIAGPINRFEDFQRDSRRRRWDSELFAVGLERVFYGFVKIVVLANFLVAGKMAAWLTGLPPDSWCAAYFGCLQYGLNLYLQFAGYSDVAIGVALLVGYRVPENFHWPFVAVNIHDFWDRWHITLSHWCRDYVFRPVAAVTRSPQLGVVASMLVLGLWHELSWRYVLWGVYHGLGIVAWRVFQNARTGRAPQLPSWATPFLTIVSWFLTMNFVILSFALTRGESLTETWSIWTTIFGG